MKQSRIYYKYTEQVMKISTGDKMLIMENQQTDHIETLFKRAGDYLKTRLELIKLKAVDKSSDMISNLVSKVIVLLVFTLFITILNIGIALFLGELLGKAYYGFFVLAGFYLIVGLIFWAFRKKWFKEPISDKLIQKFLK